MSERTSRKIPVTERQFLWVQDDDKGEVTLHVGPTMVSPTAADRVVVDDGNGGFREDPTGQPQRMIEVGDNQYAVLYNPLIDNEGGTNGKFRPGRNESRPVRNGTRAMLPGPCSFWLRPGQRAEVRDAHELASDQYLIVKVYGEADKGAPFFDVTQRSSAITRATSVSVRDAHKARAAEVAPGAEHELKRGQLVVIRGIDTQLYIPPTGLDVMPDTSVDDSNAAAALVRALEVADESSTARRRDLQIGKAAALAVDQSTRSRHRKIAAPTETAAPITVPLDGTLPPLVIEPDVDVRRIARLIRRAVVLGEKEYCVIIDADGKREIKVGPARVFPGPYDQFMVKGSRGRIYDAYELLPQRALWLRVIAPISKTELAGKLPRGVVLDKDQYHPGDELLLTGVSTFFFPFNEIEVLSPETGEAVVGNDHSRVFIESIGIDQKSGIYVRDLATGEVRLVRGKQSYLVDPRKEVQITRTVTPDAWNLWIAFNEPHKHADETIITPWALSLVVPHNTAVLATSADGQRVIEGPCVELLGYEEGLVALSLSTGTPKSDDAPLRTCFLRTVGNRVSDIIPVETADFVRINVRVSYSITFKKEMKDRWFNHENYIQVICEHLRSLIRSRCRTVPLTVLWPQIATLVRDTILGEKAADGARPGRVFTENGAHVNEVEVLSSSIEDHEIAKLFHSVQAQSVTLQIGDRQATEQLASLTLRAELERQRSLLQFAEQERLAKLAELTRQLDHTAKVAEVKNQEQVLRERQNLQLDREGEAQRLRLQREFEAKQAEWDAIQKDAIARSKAQQDLTTAEVERFEALRKLEIELLNAQSAATVAERQAVQKGLIEAMTALGDKVLLSEVASNMNLVTLFKGKDVGTLLTEVLGGTPVMPTVRALVEKYSDKPVATNGT